MAIRIVEFDPAPAPPPSAAMTETIETRAVVTWEGPGEPIMLTLYGPGGEVALPLLPKRALTLAQELLTRGVQAIKTDQAERLGANRAPHSGWLRLGWEARRRCRAPVRLAGRVSIKYKRGAAE